MKSATDIPDLPDVLMMSGVGGSASVAISAPALPRGFEAAGDDGATGSRLVPARLADFYELTKPRLNFLVVVTTAVGFFMARPAIQGDWHRWMLLFHTLLGTAMTAAGSAVLNQLVERDLDGLMLRTRNRPIPASRISALEASVFGLALCLLGVSELALFVNGLTATLGVTTLACYVLIYTPLKRVTTLCTVAGAIPGALPPVMGVTAASGAVGPAAMVLFLVLFAWQMPHFLAIAILYREDYARGGFKMLPVQDRNLLATGMQIILWSVALVPIALVAVLFGVSGRGYFIAALLLSAAFLVFAIQCGIRRSRADARRLFLASIVYLPCLLAAMIANKL